MSAKNNYQFRTTNIKGKQYVEVNERVKAFRTLSEYKGYGLTTQLLHLDENSVVVQATITNADGVVVSQGMAQEDKASSRINQTSFVENGETSAVGRALGMLGIGIETSIATADEVDMAIKKQGSAPAQSNSGPTKEIEPLHIVPLGPGSRLRLHGRFQPSEESGHCRGSTHPRTPPVRCFHDLAVIS